MDTENIVNSRQSGFKQVVEKLIHTSQDKQGSKSGIKGNMRGTSRNSESRVFKLVTKEGQLGTKKVSRTQHNWTHTGETHEFNQRGGKLREQMQNKQKQNKTPPLHFRSNVNW